MSDTGGYQRQLSLRTARAMTGVLTMKTGVSVSGQVHDSHGKPVAGARVVFAYSMTATDILETRTDAAGRFAFSHTDDQPIMPWQERMVGVEAAGFAPAWKASRLAAKPPALEFSLMPGKPFRGRVTDRQGLPVAGVKVKAEFGKLSSPRLARHNRR